MIRNVRFEEIPYEEIQKEFIDIDSDIAARLHIVPPLDTALIKKIKEIKGVGWVKDGVDYAAIYSVSLEEILLLSGCAGVWCEHMQRIVYEIVEALKREGEVIYEGPSIYPPTLNPL